MKSRNRENQFFAFLEICKEILLSFSQTFFTVYFLAFVNFGNFQGFFLSLFLNASSSFIMNLKVFLHSPSK